MENIFKNLGFTISKKRNCTKDKTITVLLINNPDGTPRWIWNANCNYPYFLKFYNISTFKARVFTFAIRTIFKLKLQNLIFKSETFYFKEEKNSFFSCKDSWSIFTGTVGPNNKAILYVNKSFYKIGMTPNADFIIANEYNTLQKIAKSNASFMIPKSKLISSNLLKLSDINKKGERSSALTLAHFKALNDINQLDTKLQPVNQWKTFEILKEDFNLINDKRIPTNLIRKIKMIIAQIDGNEMIESSFSHGDFTQWNAFTYENNIGIYDWELASSDMPKGFDFFHYIIQQGILVERKNWNSIYNNLKEQSKNQANTLFNPDNDNQFQQYLKWYLIVTIIKHLSIYASQPEWHMQVDWLLQTWNEALNIFFEDEKKSRELIIMDVFDSLHNQSYATLKFNNGYPEQLSELSDIDMVCNKNSTKSIERLLKNHSLVSKLTIVKKSFMNTIQVITNQGDLLSIDLIWQLKVRNLTILDVEKTLKNSFRNSFGVKTTSVIDTARFVALFYVLNGAKIPQKYLVYEQALTNSTNKMDEILKDYFIDDQKSKKSIENFIRSKKQNKKSLFYKNTFLYILDTIRSLIQNKGFTITFSGVDGAGKSTVITNITHQIEKQLRKPVIVLRHRPSILPILSVWTKGKSRAHQDAISNLPRQGSNTNILSSLFRFSYYYADYIIGQFIIYCKYILRGYVVVYDRYYFDFINDSKRSNIELPKWVSKTGYAFLLKPKFNFFLYADAETILNRKKELNKETIENLNNDYQSLFRSLDSKNNHSTYKSIKNDEMEATLKNILTTIKTC
jgi:thymidylate kinase